MTHLSSSFCPYSLLSLSVMPQTSSVKRTLLLKVIEDDRIVQNCTDKCASSPDSFLRRLLCSVFFQVHLKLTQETLYLNGLNVLRLLKGGRYKTGICFYLILILVRL